tara:strand:+ start:122 stop:247 length:126 start_codon:yes stop_codon:yes gene_type:complete
VFITNTLVLDLTFEMLAEFEEKRDRFFVFVYDQIYLVYPFL